MQTDWNLLRDGCQSHELSTSEFVSSHTHVIFTYLISQFSFLKWELLIYLFSQKCALVKGKWQVCPRNCTGNEEPLSYETCLGITNWFKYLITHWLLRQWAGWNRAGLAWSV